MAVAVISFQSCNIVNGSNKRRRRRRPNRSSRRRWLFLFLVPCKQINSNIHSALLPSGHRYENMRIRMPNTKLVSVRSGLCTKHIFQLKILYIGFSGTVRFSLQRCCCQGDLIMCIVCKSLQVSIRYDIFGFILFLVFVFRVCQWKEKNRRKRNRRAAHVTNKNNGDDDGGEFDDKVKHPI